MSHRPHLTILWVSCLLQCGCGASGEEPPLPAADGAPLTAGAPLAGRWTGRNDAPCDELRGEDVLTIDDELRGQATMYPLHGWCVWQEPRSLTLEASRGADGAYLVEARTGSKRYRWRCRLGEGRERLECKLADGERPGPFLVVNESASYVFSRATAR